MLSASIANRQWLIKSNLEFKRETVPLAVMPSKDYLVRVDVCGLCRTDLHFATSWANNWEHLGHEFGGTIVSARRKNGRFKVGDRVAVKNASACLLCSNCVQGRFRQCTNLIANRDGFSEYSDCDARSLVLADGLDDDMLSLVEPTNVVLDLLHSAELNSNDRLLVLGCGTLGFLSAHLANLCFCVGSIAIAGRRPQPDPAISFGAAAYQKFGQIPKHQADCVLVTTPPETLSLALEAVAPGGRILTLGLAKEEELNAVIDVRTLIFKRATLKGVFSVPNLYFEEAVDLLCRHGNTLRQIIRQRIPADNLDDWFRKWNSRNNFDGKTIVNFKDESCLLNR